LERLRCVHLTETATRMTNAVCNHSPHTLACRSECSNMTVKLLVCG